MKGERGQRQMMLINIQKGYGVSLYEVSFISGDPRLTACSDNVGRYSAHK